MRVCGAQGDGKFDLRGEAPAEADDVHVLKQLFGARQ